MEKKYKDSMAILSELTVGSMNLHKLLVDHAREITEMLNVYVSTDERSRQELLELGVHGIVLSECEERAKKAYVDLGPRYLGENVWIRAEFVRLDVHGTTSNSPKFGNNHYYRMYYKKIVYMEDEILLEHEGWENIHSREDLRDIEHTISKTTSLTYDIMSDAVFPMVYKWKEQEHTKKCIKEDISKIDILARLVGHQTTAALKEALSHVLGQSVREDGKVPQSMYHAVEYIEDDSIYLEGKSFVFSSGWLVYPYVLEDGMLVRKSKEHPIVDRLRLKEKLLKR